MSNSTNLGLLSGFAQNQKLPSGWVNDITGSLDNMLPFLYTMLQVDGVLSGWTISAGTDLKVSAGEGVVGGAHVKTAAGQTVTKEDGTALAASTTYYIFAKRKTQVTDSNNYLRASDSYVSGTVDFVANTTNIAPAASHPIAVGVTNGGATNFTTVTTNTPNGRVTLRTIQAELAQRFYEQFGEYVESGLQFPTSGTLSSDMTAGIAYPRGYRVVKNITTTKVFTASKDTYVDIDIAGTITYVEVANGAGEPAVTANSIRLQKVVTSGSAITSVVDLRKMFVDIGGINRQALSGDSTIAKTQSLYNFATMGGANRVWTLWGTPRAEDRIYCKNIDTANTWTIKDSSAATIIVLAAGDSAMIMYDGTAWQVL